MDLVAICGSPAAAGNTACLLAACLAGAREAGADTELIRLDRLTYAGCRACGTCKGTDGCVLEDDLRPVLGRLREADAVVFGSPVYGAYVSSQLKACMDRLYGFMDVQGRSRLPGRKPSALVMCQAHPDEGRFRPALESVRATLGLLFLEPEIMVFGGLGAHGAAAGRPDCADRARELGRRLAGHSGR